MQIPLTTLAGSKVRFTVFDAFAPIAGGFLGGAAGAVSVLLMQIVNLFIHGASTADAGTIIRLFPTMFAAVYFGKKTKINIVLPLVALVAFNLHPVGRSVWFYSLFWLIPIVCYFFQERFLLARSLGATFSAHAVGGALWVYFFPLSKAMWTSLIPVVLAERLLFAAGIVVAYVAMNNLFSYVNGKEIITYRFPVNEKYVWRLASL